MLLRVIGNVTLGLMKVLGKARLQAPTTTQVMEIEENIIVVTREVESSPGFTTALDAFQHDAVRFFEGAGSVRCAPMTSEFSPFHASIGLVNGRCPVVSRPPTAQPLITDVKLSEVAAENASESNV